MIHTLQLPVSRAAGPETQQMATETVLKPTDFLYAKQRFVNKLTSIAKSKTLEVITGPNYYYDKTTLDMKDCGLFCTLSQTGKTLCFSTREEAAAAADSVAQLMCQKASRNSVTSLLGSAALHDQVHVLVSQPVLDALDQTRTYNWCIAEPSYSTKLKRNKPSKIPLCDTYDQPHMVYVGLEEAVRLCPDDDSWYLVIHGKKSGPLGQDDLDFIALYHGLDPDAAPEEKADGEEEEAAPAPKKGKRKRGKKEEVPSTPTRIIPDGDAREIIVTDAMTRPFFMRGCPKKSEYSDGLPIALGKE